MSKKHEESFKKYLDKGGLPCIDIKIKGNNYVFLIDSGSDISYIDTNIAEDLCLPIIEGIFTNVTTIGAEHNEATVYNADIELSDSTIHAEVTGIEVRATTKCLLVPFDGIIGIDILKSIEAELSFTENKLIY